MSSTNLDEIKLSDLNHDLPAGDSSHDRENTPPLDSHEVEILKHSLSAQNIQITQIQNLYSNLVLERNTLDQERKHLQSTLKQLQLELQTTKRQWQEAKNKQQMTLSESQQHQLRIQNLETKLEGETRLIEEQKSKIEIQNERLKDLEKQINTQQCKIEEMSHSHSQLRSVNEALTTEIGRFETLSQKLQSEITTRDQEYIQKNMELQKTLNEQQKLSENLEKVTGQSRFMESEIEELEKAIDDLHQFAIQAKVQADQSIKNAELYHNKSEIISSDFNQFVRDVASYKNELFSLKSMSILEGDEFEKLANATRQKTVERLQGLLNEKIQEIQKWTSIHSELKENMGQMEAEFLQLKEANLLAEKQISMLQEKLSSFELERAEIIPKIQSLILKNQDLEKLQQTFSDKQILLNDLQIENSRLKQNELKLVLLEKHSQELENKLIQTQEFGEGQKKQCLNLENKLHEIREEFTKFEKESQQKWADLSAEKTQLAKELNLLREENWKLNEEVQVKSREINFQNGQLKYLTGELEKTRKEQIEAENIAASNEKSYLERIEKMNQEWNQEQSKTLQHHKSSLEQTDLNWLGKLNEVQQIKEREIIQLKDLYNQQINQLKEEHLNQIQSLKNSLSEEIEQITQAQKESHLTLQMSHNQDLEKLKQQIEEMKKQREQHNEEIKNQREQHNSLLQQVRQREVQLASYMEGINFEKAQLTKSIQEFANELNLASECNPIKDYLKATEFQLSRVEIQLKRTPVLAPDRPALEEALSQLVEQRDFLKQILLSSEKQLLARTLKLGQLLRNGSLAKAPPPPPLKSPTQKT